MKIISLFLGLYAFIILGRLILFFLQIYFNISKKYRKKNYNSNLKHTPQPIYKEISYTINHQGRYIELINDIISDGKYFADIDDDGDFYFHASTPAYITTTDKFHRVFITYKDNIEYLGSLERNENLDYIIANSYETTIVINKNDKRPDYNFDRDGWQYYRYKLVIRFEMK